MNTTSVENYISCRETGLARERKKKVAIIFEETGERFEIEKRAAIPMLEALRTRKRIEENPESMNIDVINTAKLLLTLSETGLI